MICERKKKTHLKKRGKYVKKYFLNIFIFMLSFFFYSYPTFCRTKSRTEFLAAAFSISQIIFCRQISESTFIKPNVVSTKSKLQIKLIICFLLNQKALGLKNKS